ncbi:hypothetical protein LTR36_006567 [Oleoguttula mirabilis]|uniref:non-specific serine/threonine protein kinase n=1 Tax=Oleoguttula mirabilis TaxID=1507867 RepID=A0AAV9JV16_9PEZI|nr:hypothetical protein LTR36_006567 [Oleoguttula mirabilis]
MPPAYQLRERPTEMSAGADMPGLASAFEQISIPPATSERRRDFQPVLELPDRRRSDAPVYAPSIPQRMPQMAGTAATHPGAKPTKFLRTDKATYEIIKSIDPRSDKPENKGMSYGIHLVRNIKTGFLFVEKRIKMNTESRKERAIAEVDALLQIRRAGCSYSINLIIERFWDGATAYCSVILEHCDGGTVAEIIDQSLKAERHVTDNFAWHILTGVTKALCFIHDGLDVDLPNAQAQPRWNTICHLDLKPGNVFLSSRDQKGSYPRVVLGDFGCTVTWDDIKTGKADRATQWHGTPDWHPPEIHMDPDGAGILGRYGIPTDVWQMGAIIQVMCRRVVYPRQELVDEGRPCGRRYSGDLNNMIGRTMHNEYVKRPKAVDMVGEIRRQMAMRGLVF